MIKILIFIPIICLLSGCIALHKPQSPVLIHDFGIQNTPIGKHLPKPPVKSLLITDATTPLWLDNYAIHYRLLYHNATQTYTYANNRWVAPPATLFTQQLRQRIAASTDSSIIKDSSTAKADYILHLELDEFMQIFDSASSSRAVISFRASLIERSTRNLLAQKNFNGTETAPSPDATGAVSALSSISTRLMDELVDWLSTELIRANPVPILE